MEHYPFLSIPRKVDHTLAHSIFSIIQLYFVTEGKEGVNDFDEYVNTTLTGLISTRELQYRSVTVEVCKLTCIEVVPDTCCSLLYNKRTQTCIITALEPSMPDVSRVDDPKKEINYYRRHSCNSKTHPVQYLGDVNITCMLVSQNLAVN